MQRSPTIWMIAINSISLYLPSSSNLPQLDCPHHAVLSGLLHTQQAPQQDDPKHHAGTGAWEFVCQTLVRMSRGIVSAAFVGKVIEHETMLPASPSCETGMDHEHIIINKNVSTIREHGPRHFVSPSIKRKAEPTIDVPCFQCRYAWSDLSSEPHLSPAAHDTEMAPPLPSPPEHLLQDPIINSTLSSLGDAIKVETPFNVDRLEALLVDHPNQPFVQSVMKGLREGFWPFDEGKWQLELEEVIRNYTSEEPDLEAIWVFRDNEQAAGRVWPTGRQ